MIDTTAKLSIWTIILKKSMNGKRNADCQAILKLSHKDIQNFNSQTKT